jgi:hypothetical protein
MRFRPCLTGIVAAILTASCGSIALHGGPSGDLATAARTQSPTAASTALTAPSTAPLTAGPSCKLPVALVGDLIGDRFNPDVGGFVNIATGELVTDPAGSTRYSSTDPNMVETIATPVLRSYGGGLTYDRAFSRWVPAPASLIKPDGTSYVYVEFSPAGPPVSPSRLHVVDVATGGDRVVLARGSSDIPLAFAAEGIYVQTNKFDNGAPEGLWLLNPVTGAVKTIDPGGQWSLVGGGAAWGFVGPQGGPGSPVTRVDRLDLGSGQTNLWFTAAARQSVGASGFDNSGNPVLTSYGIDDNPQVFGFSILRAPGIADPLFSSPAADGSYSFELSADRYGLWLAGSHSIYLFADGRLGLVYHGPQSQVQSITTVAGTCQ